MPKDKVKAIFFDAGGTLFRPYPSVGEVYARMAFKHGVDLPHTHIQERFLEVWHTRNGLASLAALSDDKIERDWWYGLVKDVFGTHPVGFKDFDAFFTELYDYFATAECWRMFDDTLPTLEALKRANYRLAIISNWDRRLFSIVKDLGVAPYFEEVFASSAVGIAKPGAGIFRKAMERLGVEPSEAVHIGDSLEEDYYGAQRAGLQAILLDRSRKAYNGVVRIDTLRDLLPLFS